MLQGIFVKTLKYPDFDFKHLKMPKLLALYPKKTEFPVQLPRAIFLHNMRARTLSETREDLKQSEDISRVDMCGCHTDY